MSLDRLLNLSRDLTHRSVFLFGPRQTGKTTLLKDRYGDRPWFNLLRGDEYLRLASQPGRLRQELAQVDPGTGPVVIDEIQKLPSLLDDIHNLIEERGFRFVMTGSSPVKLRRGGVNLLGGRARTRYLMPFVSNEVPDWDLNRALLNGGIPSIHLSDDPRQDLEAYCGSYVQLEVQAEGLVRGIEPFSRFLQSAARSAGEQINFERVGADAQVPPRTVREYFQVLQDTLIGVMVDPVRPGKRARRKVVSRGKFYFFDCGVANTLAGTTSLDSHTEAYGRALEQLIFNELRAWQSYRRDSRGVGFWRTTDHVEVDFVIPPDLALEVKSTRNLTRSDTRGLGAIAEEGEFARRILVCNEPVRRVVEGIEVHPVREFLELLWADKILTAPR